MVKPLESGDTCGSAFISIEPGYHTNHINGGSNAKMLQMRFWKTDIPRAAQAKGTNSPPKSSLRCLLAAHIAWQRQASSVDDELLEALHVGQTARTVMVRRLYFFSERVQ
jgi:hypothetical protein